MKMVNMIKFGCMSIAWVIGYFTFNCEFLSYEYWALFSIILISVIGGECSE